MAPRALPRFSATTGPAAAVSSSIAFPVSPVIRCTLLHRFPSGTWTVSPVAQHALATVLSLPPRRSDMPLRSVCAMPCCLRPAIEGSAFGSKFSRPPLGSLSLRPGDSLTIPRMALSVGFIRFVSSANATQATGFRLLPRRDCLPLNMPAFAGRTRPQISRPGTNALIPRGIAA